MSLTLAQYRTRTRRLLQNPPAPTSLYSEEDVDGWVNQARVQVAGESNGIRYRATIPTVIGQRAYNFSALDLGDVEDTGINGIFHIRSILLTVADGGLKLAPRAWEWFETFNLGKVVPNSGRPVEWAQYGQGSSGNFYLDPVPDEELVMICDCVCKPADIDDTEDTPPDVTPDLWSDAVPYFAAYLALLSAQTGQRQADADRMFQRYEVFAERARTFANPDESGYLYAQAKDPTMKNKLGGGGGV